MIHRMADTLRKEAENDVQACILYNNKTNIPNTKLLALLQYPYETTAAKQNREKIGTAITNSRITAAPLRPFANVRLRFI